ncbi:tRNA pseudouridine(55) synthase TruB [Comamonas endophytica]|uniref:tRNA pseudouridine(55) synthase TruB n=1 Tax=Comamonas endophytica TaxID=2949090 RepID=UPI00361F29FD
MLLDKPLGFSSNDALQKVKWLLRAEKAGHTGTLDPLASGVLPLCFGAATKFSQLQLEAAKTYVAIARLGATTTTADAEGEVVRERPVDLTAFTPERLQSVAQRFTGPISQVPPMHSALKKDGKALYEYAREGIEIERPARAVTIHALEISLCEDADGFAAVKLVVTCSKGTYIRTLGEDVGEALGCGAHLRFLRRTDTGGLGLEACVTLEALEAMDEEQRLLQVQPPQVLLHEHTPVTLNEYDAGRFLSGMRRRGDWADAPAVAVYGEKPHALLGVGHVLAGELIPDRLLSPLEIQQILEGTPRPTDRGILETL